jgi:hypothetical protein
MSSSGRLDGRLCRENHLKTSTTLATPAPISNSVAVAKENAEPKARVKVRTSIKAGTGTVER